jgi:hypothetical protein
MTTRKIIDTDATFEAAQRAIAFFRTLPEITGKLVIEEDRTGRWFNIVEIKG